MFRPAPAGAVPLFSDASPLSAVPLGASSLSASLGAAPWGASSLGSLGASSVGAAPVALVALFIVASASVLCLCLWVSLWWPLPLGPCRWLSLCCPSTASPVRCPDPLISVPPCARWPAATPDSRRPAHR